MSQTLVVQVSFWRSDRVELNSRLSIMEIYFNLNSQRNESKKKFSQEIPSFQILGNSTLIISNYKDIRKCLVFIYGLQRYGKERWWFTHKPSLIFIQLHSFKSANFLQNVPSLSRPTKYRFPSIFVISDKQSFIFFSFESRRPIARKFQIFHFLGNSNWNRF